MDKSDVIRLLIIEDEDFDVKRIQKTLEPLSGKIEVMDIVSNGKKALQTINESPPSFDVIIMDYQISGGVQGEELIREIKKIDETLQIVVITKMTVNQTDLHFANELLESGASWYGTKYPVDITDYIYQPTDFVLSIMNAFEKKQLAQERNQSRRKLDRNIRSILEQNPLVGDSRAMQEIKQQIENYAPSETNVLVTGESGTGKELVAMHLHYHSRRKYENLITVNCAAIPSELIESELFGFEKGSFTGAQSQKPGLFEQADGGTIFLDEVTELPMSAQAKLLRVLEVGEIDKIGRKQKYNVDVRVVAATNRDLDEVMDKNEFREDLYYRLNILQIEVPPLAERGGDIPQLLQHFLRYYSQDLSIPPPSITRDALALLENYQWPGNVRQVKNIVQRLLHIRVKEITEDLVQQSISRERKADPGDVISQSLKGAKIIPLREMESTFRKQYFQYVRERSNTDAEAAEKLGLAPSNFYRMCKEVGLK